MEWYTINENLPKDCIYLILECVAFKDVMRYALTSKQEMLSVKDYKFMYNLKEESMLPLEGQ